MAKKKTQDPTKRFGPRYGRTSRTKAAKVEIMQRATYRCPYCQYDAVKRLAAGIWHCSKCHAKFTGKAYTVGKTV